MGQKKKLISRRFFKFPPQIFHFVGIPAFLLVFMVFYAPFDSREYFNMMGWREFNLTIISAICLVCLVGTRLAFFFLKRVLNITYVTYAGWCVAEIAICALMSGIYVVLMKGGEASYFSVVAALFEYFLSAMVFPYIIIAGGIAIQGYNNPETEESEESMIRFKDENQNLKLSVASGAVLYLESKENYVIVWYLDNGKLKSFRLRSTVKRLEETLTSHGLVRCQRSYFVNPQHVQVLRKDGSGFIYADLDQASCPSIPVSKTYYDALSALL